VRLELLDYPGMAASPAHCWDYLRQWWWQMRALLDALSRALSLAGDLRERLPGH